MSKISIYDLVFNYIVMFYADLNVTNDIKKEAINSVAFILSQGWTAEDIEHNIKSFKEQNNGKILDLKTYFADKKPKKINLLKPFEYYYHNELRITSPPPTVTVDYNSGEIKKIIHPYFLEMRCSYTIEDLYDYYLLHENIYNKIELNYTRYIGGLKWLVDKYSLELVLYMIDAANDVILSNDLQPLSSAMDLQNYVKLAQINLEQRITEIKSSGDDKIVPKTRLLSCGGRVLDSKSK